jgi:hypothetical protein
VNTPCRVAQRLLSLHADQPCGDAAAHFELPGADAGAHLLAIVDGLGHGREAAQAAQAALHALAANPALALPALMVRLDTALQGTRGAAVGLARIDGPRLRYAGIGNTRALRWRGTQLLRLSSQYGIVGGGLGTSAQGVQVVELDLLPGDWLLLFTDGLDEMLQLPAHLPEWEREPALLCEHLLARWRHGRDDAGVLALHVAASA